MAEKMFKENARAILTYLQSHIGEDLTAKDIAAGTGIATKSITGSINGLVRKGLVVREVVDNRVDKMVRLTAAGSNVDPDAEKPE